jgi:uncharacterized LabA/DUF88 family protein
VANLLDNPLLLDPDEKTTVFIDGSNLYMSMRALNFNIDYSKLRDMFRNESRLIRIFYYTAVRPDQREHDPLAPLIDWLEYNGFTMVTKLAKEFTDNNGVRRIKGNMDIELAIDMLEMAQYTDHAVLFSGDGDFRRLIEVIQRRGVRVSVVSTTKSRPSMASDDLRRQADSFIDLFDMIPFIKRERKEEGEQE